MQSHTFCIIPHYEKEEGPSKVMTGAGCNSMLQPPCSIITHIIIRKMGHTIYTKRDTHVGQNQRWNFTGACVARTLSNSPPMTHHTTTLYVTSWVQK